MWHPFEILAVFVFAVTGSGLIAHLVFVLLTHFLALISAIFLVVCELIKWGWFAVRVWAGFYMTINLFTLIWEDLCHLPSLRPFRVMILPEWLRVLEENGHPPPPPFHVNPPLVYNGVYPPTVSTYNNRLTCNPRRQMRSLSTINFGNTYGNEVPVSSESCRMFPTYNDIFGQSVPRSRRRRLPHFGPSSPSVQPEVTFLTQDHGAGGERQTLWGQ